MLTLNLQSKINNSQSIPLYRFGGIEVLYAKVIK
uniref:Uncharacterized protein n=1 Tax=Myoviridae sp. ctIty1 TaxID=2827673 RepID=A0A8S5TGY0_9CAUD|nr:MAG TPA: hypothetical protein [Myoviridae sp. ctIty1]DAK38570.1 MAG TPA: hypothetical protein [Caudoviricetes sp.]